MNVNLVRLKKQLLLPCELFGMEGRKRMSYGRNLAEISPFNQKFYKIINTNINATQKKLQPEFTAWLGTQIIQIEVDFRVEWRQKSSRDKNML